MILGGRGCSEPRSGHCTPAWVTEKNPSQKNNNKEQNLRNLQDHINRSKKSIQVAKGQKTWNQENESHSKLGTMARILAMGLWNENLRFKKY